MGRLFLTTVLLLSMSCGTSHADVRIVPLTTERNETLRAVFGEPSVPGKRPAVIFNHGTDVRRDGYEGAKRQGLMNVDDYVKALSEQGYVAIAPLRTLLAREATLDRGRLVGTPEQWDEVIAYGIRVVTAARRYLSERPGMDSSAVVIMGYSEGGNVSLWSAIQTPGYRAVVLLSPAAMPTSRQYRLLAAARSDLLQRIAAPVFLAVAANDFRGIQEVTREALIPNLQQVNPAFRSRVDYPGDHNWFLKVRPELWNDVTSFLRQHLP